ncbi:RNA binding protein [Rhodotorula toruloides ATCC 204091]|uniref:RNA binding protein n=1 Tax=Rhodotorula toruloides TaxID=5286 RepID=A0A0K3CMP8_RHOTO|nr:RNA binding protein [Rhodotorula toruloides ATCC 204091]PRQ70391.1 RNA binding protein [Rhodotorula toruloides]
MQRETAKRAVEEEERVGGETDKVKKTRTAGSAATNLEEEQDKDVHETSHAAAPDSKAEDGCDIEEAIVACDYLDLTDPYGDELRLKHVYSVDEVGDDTFEIKDADSAKIAQVSFDKAGDGFDDYIDNYFSHPSLPLYMRVATFEDRDIPGENENYEDIKNELEVYRYLQEEKKREGEGEVYPVCLGWFQSQRRSIGWVVTLWRDVGQEPRRWRDSLAELRSLDPLAVLKRLHDLGIAHGNISSTRIFISRDTAKPLFCDFKYETILSKVSKEEAEKLKKKDEDDLQAFLDGRKQAEFFGACTA